MDGWDGWDGGQPQQVSPISLLGGGVSNVLRRKRTMIIVCYLPFFRCWICEDGWWNEWILSNQPTNQERAAKWWIVYVGLVCCEIRDPSFIGRRWDVLFREWIANTTHSLITRRWSLTEPIHPPHASSHFFWYGAPGCAVSWNFHGTWMLFEILKTGLSVYTILNTIDWIRRILLFSSHSIPYGTES